MPRSIAIRPAIVSLLIAVGLSPQLRAQRPACGDAASLSLAAGVAQHDRVDETASPFQFQGRGVALSAAGERSLGRYCIAMDADDGRTALTAREDEGGAGAERISDADAGASIVRTIASRRVHLAAGVAMRGGMETTTHAYADLEHIVSWYRLGTLSLGPAMRADARVLDGWAALELSSPLVAVVDHPYTPVYLGDASTLRVVSATQLRGLDAAIAVVPFARRAIRPVVIFRMHGLRYDDVHPVRALTQTLSVGATLALRRR